MTNIAPSLSKLGLKLYSAEIDILPGNMAFTGYLW